MKPVVSILVMSVVLALPGFEARAQEKKKECDVAYMQQKRAMDAERVRNKETKKMNDSLSKVMLRDSLAEMRRSDSIRWSKMGRQDTLKPVEPMMKEDVPPPGLDKKAPKGPNGFSEHRKFIPLKESDKFFSVEAC